MNFLENYLGCLLDIPSPRNSQTRIELVVVAVIIHHPALGTNERPRNTYRISQQPK